MRSDGPLLRGSAYARCYHRGPFHRPACLPSSAGMSNLVNPAHAIIYQDLIDLIRRHGSEVSALEVLAIAANMVGKLITMQDASLISPELIAAVVQENLCQGSRDALAYFPEPQGTA